MKGAGDAALDVVLRNVPTRSQGKNVPDRRANPKIWRWERSRYVAGVKTRPAQLERIEDSSGRKCGWRRRRVIEGCEVHKDVLKCYHESYGKPLEFNPRNNII